MVEQAQSGHPGLPMGMADVATVLFRDFLHFCPQDPTWPNRDRFILSAGHGSALLYSLLYLTGYKNITLDELKNFRQLNSKTPGHPEYDIESGIETTSGPLGQGFATSVGIALGETLDETADYKTYVLVSDGDLMEGVSYEAASFAGHLKLHKLIALWDDNNITIDGSTSLTRSEDIRKRFESAGWLVLNANGHDEADIHAALLQAQNAKQPVLIACKTTIGYGSPNKSGKASCHGSPLGQDEVQATRHALNWPHAPFDIPEDIKNSWQNFWLKSEEKYKQLSCQTAYQAKANLWNQLLDTNIPDGLATRVTSQKCLEFLTSIEPLLIGGSADLTPSNNTHTESLTTYIHYGIREHAMAACMNGLAMSGFIPYGGTFLTFSDYLRPAIRMAAIMEVGPIYVFTHDSIGLGEDGPTHQPIEHLSALQAIPNVSVWRPCNAIETKVAWLSALENRKKPTCLALSRQKVSVPSDGIPSESVKKGGYIVQQLTNPNAPHINLISSGSDVEICLNAAQLLFEKDLSVSVVSIPSLDTFMSAGKDWINHVITPGAKVVVESSEGQRWGLLQPDLFIGLSGFGASAPEKALYKHFQLTPPDVCAKVQAYLNEKGLV